MKITPVGDRLLLEPIARVTKIGNIELPDIAKNKSNRGKILAIGDNIKCKLFSAGQMVVYNEYAGQPVSNKAYSDEGAPIIVKEEDIIAIVES